MREALGVVLPACLGRARQHALVFLIKGRQVGAMRAALPAPEAEIVLRQPPGLGHPGQVVVDRPVMVGNEVPRQRTPLTLQRGDHGGGVGKAVLLPAVLEVVLTEDSRLAAENGEVGIIRPVEIRIEVGSCARRLPCRQQTLPAQAPPEAGPL